MSDRVAAGYGYEGQVGQKHRVFGRYDGNLIPLLWFRVGKEGSLYISPYVRKPAGIKTGTSTSTGSTVSIEYNDGLDFEVPGPNGSKTSFHTSGIVHVGESLASRAPLAPVSANEELCWLLFAQPKPRNYVPAAQIRKTDVITDFDMDPSRPTMCRVAYTSPISAGHRLVDLGPTEWKTIIRYSTLERVGSAILEIALFSSTEGPWPPDAYIVMKADMVRKGPRPQE